MKKHVLLLIYFIFFGCNTTSYLEDFFVPDIPFPVENLELENENLYGEIRDYEFSLFKTKFKFNLSLDKELYNEVKFMSKDSGIESGDGIRQDQYDVFVYDNSDTETLGDILSIIKNRTGRLDYDLVQILVSFVQSIEYDNQADLPKYTLETLFLNKGDCDDKSILLSKLLSYAGYETCLFIYEEGQHMAVGLKIDDYESAYKDGFVYIETTGPSPIGKIPEEFAGGISILDEDPKILYVDVKDSYYSVSGYNELNEFYKEIEDLYGEDYFYNSFDGKIIKENMFELKNSMDDINDEIQTLGGCSGTLDPSTYDLCLPLVNKLNSQISDYNKLVVRYNNLRNKDYIKI